MDQERSSEIKYSVLTVVKFIMPLSVACSALAHLFMSLVMLFVTRLRTWNGAA